MTEYDEQPTSDQTGPEPTSDQTEGEIVGAEIPPLAETAPPPAEEAPPPAAGLPGEIPVEEAPPPPPGDGRPHPLELGWSATPPPQPAGDPPDGPLYEWKLEATTWYPNNDPDNPDAATETYYMWGWKKKHIPTPAELELANAVALMEQLKARRSKIEEIIAAPAVRSLTLPGFDVTLARFSDLEDMRAHQVALGEILLDLMAAAAAVVDASLLQGLRAEQAPPAGAGAGAELRDRPAP